MPACLHDASIIFNRLVVPGIMRMRLEWPAAARHALPGQFIMVQVSEHTDPLLRRPFSICAAQHETIDILYKLVGKGTAAMALWQTGKTVNCIGPLGNGFNIAGPPKRAYLVAGGIGIAPLLFLFQTFHQRYHGSFSAFFVGGKTARDVAVVDDFFDSALYPNHIFYATEDAARGFPGLVTDLLLQYFQDVGPESREGECLFGCGPIPMLSRLSAIAEHRGIDCHVSLESRMACGIGACLGCAIKTRTLPGSALDAADSCASEFSTYKRVCTDGPVFNSAALVWGD